MTMFCKNFMSSTQEFKLSQKKNRIRMWKSETEEPTAQERGHEQENKNCGTSSNVPIATQKPDVTLLPKVIIETKSERTIWDTEVEEQAPPTASTSHMIPETMAKTPKVLPIVISR